MQDKSDTVLTQQDREELLSISYALAVATMAGISFEDKQRKDKGVDGRFERYTQMEGHRPFPSGFPLDVQLKASINVVQYTDDVSYELDVATYNALAKRNNTKGAMPCVLMVLCLPKDSKEWLEVTEEKLLMRNCCYWYIVKGAASSNKSSETLRIPRENVVTPANLLMLMQKIETGTV